MLITEIFSASKLEKEWFNKEEESFLFGETNTFR